MCGSRPIVTQDTLTHPPILEEDITELPYAASVHDVPGEYDIGAIVSQDTLLSRNHSLSSSVRRDASSLPQHNEGQDLADALVPDNRAPIADTFSSRPRTRKDGLGATGWEDRMQQWKQDIPGEDT